MIDSKTLTLRRLNRAQIQPWIGMLNEWLLPGAIYGVDHTWPQLYRSDGDGRFLAYFDGDRMVSHCAFRFARLRTKQGERDVALLGSVTTDPGLRGQGLASRLLETALQECQAAGAAAVLLWAERPELYSRAGFEPGTPEPFLLIRPDHRPLGDGEVLRTATIGDHESLRRLHDDKPLGIVRDRRTMSALLTTPGMTACVLERDGEVVAYACSGKGADLQGWWHECGGSDQEVARLLPAAARLTRQPNAFVLCPPYRTALPGLLEPWLLEAGDVAGPMVRQLGDAAVQASYVDGLDSV